MIDIEWLDIKLFYLINNGMQNRLFDILMPWLTEISNWWPLIVPTVIGLLIWGGKKGRVAVIVIVVAVGLSDYTSGGILKYMIGRIKPCNYLEGVNLLVYCGKYSFPSSHAANMFAVAVTGSYYYRKARIPLFILAAVIGYSRVYVGVHFPFDVLGGFIWGGMVATAVIWVEKRISDKKKKAGMNDFTQNSKPGTKNFLIVAGEASGDLHGANLVRELLALDPNISFFGMGGDMMKEAGVNISHHVREMAIVGIFEVINKLPLIRKAMRDMEELMDVMKPEVVVLIDYPGFNLRLARKAKARGIKVVYYISPQVWAWHKSRVKTIAKVVDKMMVAFPFEVPIYEKAGVDVEFVGHPLMDSVPAGFDRGEIRRSLGFGGADTVIGLLPGSRKREVESLLPEMLKAARVISKKVEGAKFAIPVANTLDVEYIKGFTDSVDIDIHIFKGNTYDVMAAADLILIASGTATLEAAIVGTPMVMTYRMAPLTYFIGRRLVNLEFGSLPNIIAGKGIIPELVQGDATGERMAEECLNILGDKKRSEEMKRDLRKVRETLGGPGASKRAAEIVSKVLKCPLP